MLYTPYFSVHRLPLASKGAKNYGYYQEKKNMAAYISILVFLAMAAVMAAAMLIIPRVVAPQKAYAEKNSAYECGFEAFDDARGRFDIRFYLVAILFVVFDLEVAFLFPWAMVFKSMGWFGFTSMMLFLGVLTVGFVYEWKKGALEWE